MMSCPWRAWLSKMCLGAPSGQGGNSWGEIGCSNIFQLPPALDHTTYDRFECTTSCEYVRWVVHGELGFKKCALVHHLGRGGIPGGELGARISFNWHLLLTIQPMTDLSAPQVAKMYDELSMASLAFKNVSWCTIWSWGEFLGGNWVLEYLSTATCS